MSRNHFFKRSEPAPGVPTFRTVCMVPVSITQTCNHEIIEVSLDGVVGPDKEKQTERFVRKLMEHVAKEHPQRLQEVQQLSARFFGFLILTSFQTESEAVQKQQGEFARFLRAVSAIQIPDDDFIVAAEAITRKAYDSEDEEAAFVSHIAGSLQNLRDFMNGKIAPANTAETQVEPEE